MKNVKLALLLVIGLAIPSSGFSQSGSGGGTGAPPPTGPTATGTGTASSLSVVNQSSNERAGFLQAVPGSVPEVIPGYAPNISCFPYVVAGLPDLTDQMIDSMAQGGKLPHGLHVTTIDPTGSPYSGPIMLTTYFPRLRSSTNPGDEILASLVIPGKFEHTDEQLLGVAIKELRKAVPAMERVAVVNCPEIEAKTKALGGGVGGSFSEVPGGGNTGNGAALGFYFGSSRSRQEEHSVFYLYALNHGLRDLIPPQPQQQQPPPQIPPAPAVTEHRPALAVQPPAPPPPPPATTAAPVPPPAPAKLPTLVVHFAFDCSDIDAECVRPGSASDPDWHQRGTENKKVLAELRNWLVEHPDAKVDVIGSADHYNTFNYNAGLGWRRADHVFAYLLKTYPEIAGQLFEPDSNSKFHAAPTGSKQQVAGDRRVIFEERGPDSSGK